MISIKSIIMHLEVGLSLFDRKFSRNRNTKPINGIFGFDPIHENTCRRIYSHINNIKPIPR